MPAPEEHTIDRIADAVSGSRRGQRLLVGVDGVDASGKTTFAARLAGAVRARGRGVVVIHVDDFMHVRSVRHRRGRDSPEGYLHDSYDYPALQQYALAPLSRSGSGWFRAGNVDRARDAPREFPLRYAGTGTVAIVEGLFVLRDELTGWWDFSVFLDVDARTSLARKECRDGLTLDGASPLTRRYLEGQRSFPAAPPGWSGTPDRCLPFSL